jgi:hypothetical protein
MSLRWTSHCITPAHVTITTVLVSAASSPSGPSLLSTISVFVSDSLGGASSNTSAAASTVFFLRYAHAASYTHESTHTQHSRSNTFAKSVVKCGHVCLNITIPSLFVRVLVLENREIPMHAAVMALQHIRGGKVQPVSNSA